VSSDWCRKSDVAGLQPGTGGLSTHPRIRIMVGTVDLGLHNGTVWPDSELRVDSRRTHCAIRTEETSRVVHQRAAPIRL
jgi:hypothetical protein